MTRGTRNANSEGAEHSSEQPLQHNRYRGIAQLIFGMKPRQEKWIPLLTPFVTGAPYSR